ncbi:MAG: hypothetical protein K0V04_32170 [Deltaproteobacteria bacterium]|nr:hypothetical protein [Deltaproteobacteria bacterium]
MSARYRSRIDSTPAVARLGLPTVVAAFAAAGLLCPPAALAIDGQRLRTPVLWSDVPCMRVIDRSSEPIANLPYDIPFEDTEVTEDEVADGRRHQFFALCRGHDPDEELPQWISEADVAAAEARELVDLGTVVGNQVLDLHPEWATCALRINADAERRPITFDAAAEGVDWDTTTVPAGTYVIEGYTHDPAASLWSPRPGVIKVVDEPDPAASGPAAAVLNGEEVVEITESVTLEGCVSAMAGATLSASWAPVGGGDAWQPFLQDEPVQGESFALEMLLDPEMAGQSVRVRVVVEDPMNREYTAYMRERVITLPSPGSDEGGCSSEDDCDTTSAGDGTDTGDGTDPDGTGTSPTADPDSASDSDASDDGTNTAGATDGDDGCGCHSAPGRVPSWWAALLLLAVRRRRS